MSPSLAFLFPGQGSQAIGMGRAWADSSAVARVTFEEADSVLGFAVGELCWQGPEADLQLTANTQPAILATSVAIFRALSEEGIEARIMAGHSLGEYSALVAAGSLGFADALRLVRRRGQLMQEAVPVGEGAMAAILGLEVAQVAAVADQAAGDGGEVCAVANLNAPTQIVIAGNTAAVERAIELAKESGARRAVLLPVSAPFHSPLMAPARQGLTPDLESTAFADPDVPVVSNIDALPVLDGEAARQGLIRQIDGPVRWVESLQWMSDQAGTELYVEVGPGTVLTGLVRRGGFAAQGVSLSEPDAIPKLRQKMESSE